VEWNPTGDEWKPATVHLLGGVGVLIRLDENGQTLLAQPEHLRCETMASVRAGRDRLAAELAELHTWLARHREQLARDLAHTSDPALKMRVAELVAVRKQCRASESDCDAWWELADLRWVLARRAESAGSIPQGDGDLEHRGERTTTMWTKRNSSSGRFTSDLAAVQADDALLDELGTDSTPSDADVARALLAWRRDVDAEPIPRGVDVDTALAIVRARSRRSLVGRVVDAVRRLIGGVR
ncbi:MAG: hypothetical protein ACR2KO_15870, partial [Geodermatophilaceae bacterium]